MRKWKARFPLPTIQVTITVSTHPEPGAGKHDTVVPRDQRSNRHEEHKGYRHHHSYYRDNISILHTTQHLPAHRVVSRRGTAHRPYKYRPSHNRWHCTCRVRPSYWCGGPLRGHYRLRGVGLMQPGCEAAESGPLLGAQLYWGTSQEKTWVCVCREGSYMQSSRYQTITRVLLTCSAAGCQWQTHSWASSARQAGDNNTSVNQTTSQSHLSHQLIASYNYGYLVSNAHVPGTRLYPAFPKLLVRALRHPACHHITVALRVMMNRLHVSSMIITLWPQYHTSLNKRKFRKLKQSW